MKRPPTKRIPNRRDQYGLTLAEREARIARALRTLGDSKTANAEEIATAVFQDVLDEIRRRNENLIVRAKAREDFLHRMDSIILRGGTEYPDQWPWPHITRERVRLGPRSFETRYRWSTKPQPGAIAASRFKTFRRDAGPDGPTQVWIDIDTGLPEAPPSVTNGIRPEDVNGEQDEPLTEAEWTSFVRATEVDAPPTPQPAGLSDEQITQLLTQRWEEVGTDKQGNPILRRVDTGALYRVQPI